MTVGTESEPLSQRALMRSTSVRECEQNVANLLHQHRLHLAKSADLDASVNGVSIGGVSLYYMSYRAHLAVTASPMTDFMAICLPLEGSLELRQGRTRFEAQAGRGAAVLTFDEAFAMEWSADLSMFLFKIDVSALRDFAASLDPQSDDDLQFKREVSDPRTLKSLAGCARVTELAVAQLRPGQRIPPALAARLRDHILLTALVAQPNSQRPHFMTRDRTVRRGAVAKAIDFIEAHPVSATPNEVARQAGLSARALQENFKSALGTTPYAYILKTRLRRAHEELQAGDRELGATVTDVAKRWGFNNIGRFAEQYAQAYRQRPSETLRGARRAPSVQQDLGPKQKVHKLR
ncbi:AraC family transcriptional regulator [Mycolicibacterium moriokaense]|uniref:AraC-like protein n=1 Tax=Mycolicibacterium moriokaense TaxID=39691 RepID=A0A318H6L7_9MYCO|nr:AraC family transcriptional regulator [Mycolicibacterium moriokaense]PXW99866.1 AraC-like protein [Mycolicibacterium moriokaense]